MKSRAAERTQIRSVSRALSILEHIAQAEAPLGLVAISKAVGLDPTTTHRLLHTMAEHCFVTQNQADGKYTLDVRAFQIGNSVTRLTMLRQVVRPFLQVLMAHTGETANLATRNGSEAVYIEQVTSPHFLRTFNEVGRNVPLHTTAVGKALLMGSSEGELEQLAARGLKRYTPNSITTLEALVAEIERCKELGYASDLEEFEPGARCLGVPIISGNKIVGAISASGPASRLTPERFKAIITIITNSAAEISQALKFTTAALA